MISLGKLLIGGGVALALVGVVLWLVGRTGFSGLPGDIRYSRGNFTFFFPLATSIVLSIILSIVLNLIARMRR